MRRLNILLGICLLALVGAWSLHTTSSFAQDEKQAEKVTLPSECMKGCYDVYEVQMSSCEKKGNGVVKGICEGNAFGTYTQCMKDCRNLADSACQDRMVVHLKACDEVVGTKEKCEKRALATSRHGSRGVFARAE